MGKELSDIEKVKLRRNFFWACPDGLVGVVCNSLQELRERVPDARKTGRILSNISGGQDCDEYRNKRHKEVAYGCHGCEKIIMGPPQIRQHEGNFFRYYCTHCDAPLYQECDF